MEKGSKVELRGGLMLSDLEGRVIWREEIMRPVFYAAMLETGNFVLAYNDSFYARQSFNHLTDTILPSQKLELDGSLCSRPSELQQRKV